MPTTKRDQILRMLKKTRVLRPQDVEAVGISRTYLNKLHAQGVLDRPSRGLYCLQDDDEYQGIRLRIEARLGNIRLALQIDIGFGDAITPGPQSVTYPTLLDFPAPQLNAYPRETVVAEKFQAMVQLGNGQQPDEGFLRRLDIGPAV